MSNFQVLKPVDDWSWADVGMAVLEDGHLMSLISMEVQGRLRVDNLEDRRFRRRGKYSVMNGYEAIHCSLKKLAASHPWGRALLALHERPEYAPLWPEREAAIKQLALAVGDKEAYKAIGDELVAKILKFEEALSEAEKVAKTEAKRLVKVEKRLQDGAEKRAAEHLAKLQALPKSFFQQVLDLPSEDQIRIVRSAFSKMVSPEIKKASKFKILEAARALRERGMLSLGEFRLVKDSVQAGKIPSDPYRESHQSIAEMFSEFSGLSHRGLVQVLAAVGAEHFSL